MEQAWQDYVAQQEIVVAMRFSYFGNSGWKSDFSKDMALLFEPARLALRLVLAQSLPLRSLAAQTDQNFHLMILCSEAMPVWAHDSLAEICAKLLPAGKYSIVPRKVGVAHAQLGRFLRHRYGQGRVIQTILDDDDAFSNDLIAQIRVELAALPAPTDADDLRFVSFARGYGLDMSGKDSEDYALYHHRYPFINLGLTMVSQAGGKNLFSIRHRKTPLQSVHTVVRNVPMFVRSVHEVNDSRVEVTERWKPVANWRSAPDIVARFPFLPRL